MMKRFLSLFLIVAMAVCLFPALKQTALAGDDDFEMTYAFNPETAGYTGAQVELLLTITNTGDTDITRVAVKINTHSPYTADWTVTIAPGGSRTRSFMVPFSQSDMNVTKYLQVAVYRPGKSNPDGVQMYSFEIEGKTKVFDVEHSVDIDNGTVSVTHEWTNTIETHAALNVQTRVSFNVGDESVYTGPVENHGTVFPGASFTSSFSYTLDDDQTGDMVVQYQVSCTIVGAVYTFEENWLAARIAAQVVPDIAFTASLFADTTTVDAGEDVTLRIAIGNTGEDAIGTFEVRSADGERVATAEGLPAGGSGSVTLTESFDETQTVSYTVVGQAEGSSVSHETNAVTITVRETDTGSADSPAATLRPDAVSTAPTSEPAVVAAPDSASQPSVFADTTDESERTAPPSNTVLYIIIGVLGLLLIAAAVVFFVILKKKKDKKASS